MLPTNTSTPEAVWSAVTGIAVLINAGLLRIGAGDLLALYRTGHNGAKRIAAWTAVGVKGVLTLVQAIFCGVGLYAASQPPANPDHPVPATTVVLSSGLIAAAVLLAGLGVFMHARRLRLLDYLADERSQAAQHDEMMGELHHNTALTEVAGAAAGVAQGEAAVAQVAAEAARDEAEKAKNEAMAAHRRAREILERIDDATRDRAGEDGGPS